MIKALKRSKAALKEYLRPGIATPGQRRRSMIFYLWVDHGILRYLWTNFYPVAPGVWRSNQPHHARLARWKAEGIRTIVNLRGSAPRPPQLFEEESCAALDLTLVSISMSARKAAPRAEYLKLFEVFDTAERPMVVHCKSGADRTGIVSALYLMDQTGATLDVARQHLRFWPYLHLRRTDTGILDHILDLYERHCAQVGPMLIREWFETEYDPAVATESFAAHRARRFRWPD